MQLRKFLVVCLCLLISVSSFAADPEPMVMMKNTTDQMLRELNKHLGNLKNNEKLINSLVNTIIVPHFDLVKMSQGVVGPYWREASSNTQQQFVKEFTRHVIRTYSSALECYDGETMKFYPIRGDVVDKVRISSDLLLKNGPPIQLQYGLIKQNGKWSIYDFSVDGVSIIKNYNAQFAGILSQGGLDGLVRRLQKRNLGK